MRDATESAIAILLTCAGFLACGGSQNPAQAPSSTEDTTARPKLTAQACEASGGSVVGDIGNGAVHRPDYRCPSGAKPSAEIRPAEAGLISVEGSVCCPK
jgi:hypothetical protein